MNTKTPRFLLARRFALPALFAVSLGIAPFACATNYTWDPYANRSDAAGSGVWSTAANNGVWDNGTSDVVWPNSSSFLDNAFFNGADGNYTVSVANGINAPNVFFNASGYTLTGASAAIPGTLSLSSGNFGIAAGKTLTIGSNMTVSIGTGAFNATGLPSYGGTVVVNNGGVLNLTSSNSIGGNFVVGASSTAGNVNATYSMANGSISINGTGAQFLARGITMTSTTATLTQGTFNTGGGQATSLTNSTLNLNGGIFITGYFNASSANSTVNFNGSTVQNTGYGGFSTGSNQAGRFVVQAGGAKFDLTTDMTLSPVLQHDTAGLAIDGGLTKSGGARLTLSAANTYTGGTVISGGRLIAGTNGALGTGDASVLATSVSLSISTGVTNPFNGVLGHLTLTGGGAAGTADNGYLDLTSGASIVVGSLTLGGTTYNSGVFSSANFPEYFSGAGIVTVVPEPGSLALVSVLAAGLGVVVVQARRRATV